jgi:oxygen-independent coproporphyrinogen III oxidase
MINMIGLYVHIPFCEAICTYCDFPKRIPKNQQMIKDYLYALKKELMTYQALFDQIKTVYIGGGTPSMLSIDDLTFLFDMLAIIKPHEYTIEVNPESYTAEKGKLFQSYGINRISLGVQTFNPEVLKQLNRKHKNEDVYFTIKHLKSLNITNINIDLIYACPNQTLDDLKHDLDHIEALDISHISAYSLILEEKTKLYHLYVLGKYEVAEEDLEANMYDYVIERLTQMNFEHYEISNFAKKGLKSVHNTLYWKQEDCIGIGLGAHGLVNNIRTSNVLLIKDYLINPRQSEYQIEVAEQCVDHMIFGLRMIEGVSMMMIKQKFNIDPLVQWPKLNECILEGLLELKDDHLKLTRKGLSLGNQVFMVFV